MIRILKDKKFMRETALILLGGIVINIACFLMCSLTGHCATPTPFPYYCYNDTYNTAILPYIDGIVASVKDKWYEQGDDPFVIVMQEVWWKDTDTSEPYWAMEGYVFWEVDFNDVLGESYASRPYEFLSHSSGNAHRFDIWLDTYRIYSFDNRVSGNFEMLGNQTIHQTTIGTYTWGYPIYVSAPIETRVGAKNFTVIANSEAQDPNGDLITSITDLPNIDDILGGITNSYNNTALQTFPSYNGSLSIGENIENYIDWLGQTINNGFNNLGNSVKDYFNNLSNSLQSWLSSINNNIYNGFKNFVDNLQSFFKPYLDDFKEKLADIVEKLGGGSSDDTQEQIKDALENTAFYNDIDSLGQLTTDSLAIWNSTSQPDSFAIPLHLENVTILNVDECQYIDLGLYQDVFPYIRGVMWALLVYSLVYTVIDSIASYIGGGDE